MASPSRLSPYATPSATREVLERHGLYTKYALGQNFLVNDDVVRKIVELADVRPTDCILEVGPGIGTLTSALLQKAGHVTSVEMDHDLPFVLQDTLAPWLGRFTLLEMDALDLRRCHLETPGETRLCHQSPSRDCQKMADRGREGARLRLLDEKTDGSSPCAGPSAQAASPSLSADLPFLDSLSRPHVCTELNSGEREHASADLPGAAEKTRNPERPLAAEAEAVPGLQALPNKLVSNLPYAVAATIVLDYLQRFDFLESATVMVQKEVADRMMAHPGTKTYGAYTVKLSLCARAVGRFSVAPGNFFPPPHVESAVIRLDRAVARDDAGSPLAPAHLKAACIMADAAFATRRKTLANSCKTYFAGNPDVADTLPHIFEQAGIDPRRRGETLDLAEFIRLGAALVPHVSEQDG